MKKLTLALLLLGFSQLADASYGLNSSWREVKERVTLEFALETKREQGALQSLLEDNLGQELLLQTSANGHYQSFESPDASFSQCLPALNCGQYECMMNAYKCEQESFLPSFPVRVCKSFEDDINLGRYDEEGVLWVYQATYCLQKMAMMGLLDSSRSEVNRCDVIEEQIVNRHEECFFEQQKSLCELSFQNKKAVFTTLLPHGGRFVRKNNRIDWHRVKILWDHFSRCPLRDIFKEDRPECTAIKEGECKDDECLQAFADSLNCFLK